jgi:hypothetical protein
MTNSGTAVLVNGAHCGGIQLSEENAHETQIDFAIVSDFAGDAHARRRQQG